MSALDPSRLQFAVTAVFHMTFPAVTVGLGVFLALVYGAWLRTRDPVYLQMFRFWRKIFAVGFGLGVVAGIVLTFEFGLNWSGYAYAVGPVLGPIIGMEVVTAFFLEAAFLGIMLYGEGRVSERLMMFSTCMVALGSLLSTMWILAANSWMQTPAGYRVVDGQFQVTDWWRAIVNPSFLLRWPHVVVGVLLAAALLLTGIAAYYLRQGRHRELARRTLAWSLGAVVVLTPLQMFVGGEVAGLMWDYQPAKQQAFNGNWDSTNTAFNLIVIPDQAAERNVVQIGVPCMGSVLLEGDWSCQTPVAGLKETPAPQRPNMAAVFWGSRVMMGAAWILLPTVLLGIILALRRRLDDSRRYLRWLTWLTPAGILAVLGGWVTAETGRQPYVVYGELLTADAVSPLSSGAVVASLVGFGLLYATLLGTYVVIVRRIVRAGPKEAA